MNIPIVVYDLCAITADPENPEIIATYRDRPAVDEVAKLTDKHLKSGALLVQSATSIEVRERRIDLDADSIDHAASMGYRINTAALTQMLIDLQAPTP